MRILQKNQAENKKAQCDFLYLKVILVFISLWLFLLYLFLSTSKYCDFSWLESWVFLFTVCTPPHYVSSFKYLLYVHYLYMFKYLLYVHYRSSLNIFTFKYLLCSWLISETSCQIPVGHSTGIYFKHTMSKMELPNLSLSAFLLFS